MLGSRSWHFMPRLGAWIAIAILVAQPQFLLAESAQNVELIGAPRVIDVALQPGGVLQGRVMGSQGQLLSQTQVTIVSGSQQWTVTTDAEGLFALNGLAGATYQIRAGNHSQLLRAWAPGTAPPRAINEVMVVPDSSAVLGQNCGAPICGSGVCGASCLRNPLILGGIIAAAIAIPIAVSNSDDVPVSP